MGSVREEPLSERLLEDIPTHPEEIKTVFNLRVGKSISLQGSARITPAGVVTAAIAACSILRVAALSTRMMRGERKR